MVSDPQGDPGETGGKEETEAGKAKQKEGSEVGKEQLMRGRGKLRIGGGN